MNERIKKVYLVPDIKFDSPRIKRVAAYCRVSTVYEEQTTSIESQIAFYKEMISEHSNWQLVGIYADRKTGRNTQKCPQLNEMLENCRAGNIDLIITKSISRFGRNTLQLLQTVEELKSLNVDVYFETNKLYLHDPKSMLMITIFASLAQNESENKSADIRWGIRRSFQDENTKYANRACYGYSRGTDNSLIVDPYEAVVVTMIFQLYLYGYSLGRISKELLEIGILSPSGSMTWGRETLRYLLSNEKYKGDIRLQKTFVSDFFLGKQMINHGELTQYYINNAHERIIKSNIFEEVQMKKILRSNKSNKPVITYT